MGRGVSGGAEVEDESRHGRGPGSIVIWSVEFSVLVFDENHFRVQLGEGVTPPPHIP